MSGLFMIHASPVGGKVNLCGEGAADSVGLRFNKEEAIAFAKGVRALRLDKYGLESGVIYVSDRGRNLVWSEPEGGAL